MGWDEFVWSLNPEPFVDLRGSSVEAFRVPCPPLHWDSGCWDSKSSDRCRGGFGTEQTSTKQSHRLVWTFVFWSFLWCEASWSWLVGSWQHEWPGWTQTISTRPCTGQRNPQLEAFWKCPVSLIVQPSASTSRFFGRVEAWNGTHELVRHPIFRWLPLLSIFASALDKGAWRCHMDPYCACYAWYWLSSRVVTGSLSNLVALFVTSSYVSASPWPNFQADTLLHITEVEELLQHGAPLRQPNAEGLQAVHLSVRNGRLLLGRAETVELMESCHICWAICCHDLMIFDDISFSTCPSLKALHWPTEVYVSRVVAHGPWASSLHSARLTLSDHVVTLVLAHRLWTWHHSCDGFGGRVTEGYWRFTLLPTSNVITAFGHVYIYVYKYSRS